MAEPTREEVLKIYERDGASAAASLAGVSTRTVKRWAAQEGVSSGYTAPIIRGHGTAACYIRGCRETKCVEANREVQREVKRRRIERYRAGKVTIKHGVSGYSNWDCRCGECTSSWSTYLRERRHAAVQSNP